MLQSGFSDSANWLDLKLLIMQYSVLHKGRNERDLAQFSWE